MFDDPDPPPSPDVLDAAVLGLILHRHPAPVHETDLACTFEGDDWPSSISALIADGIVHREGALHLASRPAVRVAELIA